MELLNLNSFEMEQLRDKLARNNKYKLLYKTYNDIYSEIKDLNNQDFWDKKLESDKNEMNKSSIFIDKIDKVINFLKKKEGKMLNIGFGNGLLERKLGKSNEDLELFGIDISRYAVKKMNKRLTGEYKLGNIIKIPFKSSAFDYIIALDVLEHIRPSKTLKALSEVNRVLKKGGVLIVSVPLNEDLENMLKKGENPNEHLRVYTIPVVIAELKFSKFKPFKEYFLYAFKSFYKLKTFVIRLLPIELRKPNLLILFAKK